MVSVNANDTACLGCRPRWLSTTILLPPNTTRGQLRRIWSDIAEDMRRFGIASAGGHTEVWRYLGRYGWGYVCGWYTQPHFLSRQSLCASHLSLCRFLTFPPNSSQHQPTLLSSTTLAHHIDHGQVTAAVQWPVVAGHMIGERIGSTFLDPRRAHPGCCVLLGGHVGLEGAAVLAGERRESLRVCFSEEELDTMVAFLQSPGICVWPLVSRILPDDSVLALHDPTEV